MGQLLLPIFPHDTCMITMTLGVREQAFFIDETCHGWSHKLLSDVLLRIQAKLKAGQSVNSITKQEGLSESGIRAATKNVRFKKRFT